MLSLEDCLALCELSEDEVLAIAHHEHVPEIAAAELGNYLIHTPEGEMRIKAIIRTWRRNEALAVEHRTVNGRDVPFVVVGKPVDASEIAARPHLQTCGAESAESAADDPR